MSKIGSYVSFEYLKNKLWSKEGLKVKVPIDYQWLQIRNHPDLLLFRWHATSRWKALNEGYNFVLDLTSIGGLHKKLWASKVGKVLISRISTKWHLGATPMAKHKKYYNEDGGDFLQVWAMVSLMNPCMFVVYPSPKSF
jgi:hypothetical protein